MAKTHLRLFIFGQQNNTVTQCSRKSTKTWRAILSRSQNVLKSISCVYLQMAAESWGVQNSSCSQLNCAAGGIILWANTRGDLLNFGTTLKMSAELSFFLSPPSLLTGSVHVVIKWENANKRSILRDHTRMHARMYARTYFSKKKPL